MALVESFNHVVCDMSIVVAVAYLLCITGLHTGLHTPMYLRSDGVCGGQGVHEKGSTYR